MRIPAQTIVTIALWISRATAATVMSPTEADTAADIALHNGFEVYDLFSTDPEIAGENIYDFYEKYVTGNVPTNTSLFEEEMKDLEAQLQASEELDVKVDQKVKARLPEDIAYEVLTNYIGSWGKASNDECAAFLTSMANPGRFVILGGRVFVLPHTKPIRKGQACGAAVAAEVSLLTSRYLLQREFGKEPVQPPSSALLESLENSFDKQEKVVYLKHLDKYAYKPFEVGKFEDATLKAAVVPSFAMYADKEIEQFKSIGNFKNVAGMVVWLEYERKRFERGKKHILTKYASKYWSTLVRSVPIVVGATEDGNDYVVVAASSQREFSSLLQSSIVASGGAPKSFDQVSKAGGLVSLAINKRAVDYPLFDKTATYSTIEEATEAKRNHTLREAMIKADRVNGLVTTDSTGKTLSKENIAKMLTRYCDTFPDADKGLVVESELRFGSVSSKIDSQCQSGSEAYLKSINDGTVDLYTGKTIAPKTVVGKVKNALKAGLKKVAGVN